MKPQTASSSYPSAVGPILFSPPQLCHINSQAAAGLV